MGISRNLVTKRLLPLMFNISRLMITLNIDAIYNEIFLHMSTC